MYDVNEVAVAQAEYNGQVEEEHEEPALQYAAVDIHHQYDQDDEEDFDDKQRLIP